MDPEKKVDVDWREKVSQNLDYYLDTEEGRKELSEMMQAEAQALREYVLRTRQRIKDLIWLSEFCLRCSWFAEMRKNWMRCEKHDARIVKPFYGKPQWATAVSANGEQELFIVGFEWNSKAIDVPDVLVERAIKRINRGMPYTCFEPR